MAVPARKVSRSVTRKRRTHKKLQQVNFITCSNCGELILPHHVCSKCGHYYKKKVIELDD